VDFTGIREALRQKPPQVLHCQCCGEPYERGRFRCCAPPKGMASQNWLARFCKPISRGGCGRCPMHCRCLGEPEKPPATEFQAFLQRMRDELSARRQGR
jgi:hypothetical protein